MIEVGKVRVGVIMFDGSKVKPTILRSRYKCYSEKRQLIDGQGGLKKFCESYKEYGLHLQKDGTLVGTEWAPGAKGLYLRGNFNDWNNKSHPYKSAGFGEKSP